MSDRDALDELRYAKFAQEEEEYSDSQRLDELNTADDYNRFEEEQLAQDRDTGEFDDYDDDRELGGEG